MTTLLEYQLSKLDRAANDTNDDAVNPNPGYLDQATVKLTKSSVPINENTTQTELETAEADFTGYAAATITWNDPSVAADGTVEVVSDQIEFRPTDDVTPNEIYDIWIAKNGAGELLFAAEFDGAPLPMGNSEDSLFLNIRFRPADDSMVVTIS